MRKRFNRTAICSSSNYSASKKSHIELLKENHINNAEVFNIISCKVQITKQAYITCFGKLIPISREEIILHNTLDIIYK